MPLIDNLIKEGYLKTPEYIKVFRRINRKDFVLPDDIADVEFNAPLAIGYGQTVSQPATVALMIELLHPEKGEKILDVGSGSGWTTALLAEIAGENGKVFGIELIKELKEFGEANAAKYGFVDSGRVKMFKRDGYKGLPEYAPFDKILVSAAAPDMPVKLLAQLKIGGRMVIPIGGQHEMQEVVVVDKTGGEDFDVRRYPGFVFVPLVKK